MPAPRIIALTGLKHVGKSSVCRYISAHSNRLSADTDDEIVRIAMERLTWTPADQVTPRDVYRHVGAEAFATLETAALEGIIERPVPDDAEIVLATGGGICDNPDAFALLQRRAEIVFLDAPPDLLYGRIAKGGVPAFLDPERPYEHFLTIAAMRRERYRAAADFHVDVGLMDTGRIGDAIIKHFR
jgi:shikimate kinase